MTTLRATDLFDEPPMAGPCACESPVCPMDHPGDLAARRPDPGMIGLAVGVRRVVVLPVPRLRRRIAPSLPRRLTPHLPVILRRARA